MSERHHTVPKRALLLGFADPKERLRAFDRQKQLQIPLTIRNASVVTDFYRLDLKGHEGVDDRMVENLLGEIETAAAPAVSRIRKGESAIDAEARPVLASFIAMQLVRTIGHRDRDEEFADWYAKVWFTGMTREDVKRRLEEEDLHPRESEIDSMMEAVDHPERFRFVPPKNESLQVMLTVYTKLVEILNGPWNWIVVHSSKRPSLTSDNPVVLVGDTVDGGVGVGTAAEIWMPVGRHHAVVLSREHSLAPVLLDIRSDHVRRICQRIALEAHRWVYWHPKDQPLEGTAVPPRESNLVVETLGWRERENGNVGEIIRSGRARPAIPGECLLSGRPVAKYHAVFDGLKTRDELRQPHPTDVGD